MAHRARFERAHWLPQLASNFDARTPFSPPFPFANAWSTQARSLRRKLNGDYAVALSGTFSVRSFVPLPFLQEWTDRAEPWQAAPTGSRGVPTEKSDFLGRWGRGGGITILAPVAKMQFARISRNKIFMLKKNGKN